jgi:hypothetical protein
MTPDSAPQIPITALAFSLSAFLVITFLLCIAAGFFVSNLGAHALLQFFPRFSWTDTGIHHGLIESLAYGWYGAIVFGALFNFFARRGRSGKDRVEGPMVSNV